jgi:hypothetical protein
MNYIIAIILISGLSLSPMFYIPVAGLFAFDMYRNW